MGAGYDGGSKQQKCQSGPADRWMESGCSGKLAPASTRRCVFPLMSPAGLFSSCQKKKPVRHGVSDNTPSQVFGDHFETVFWDF